VARAQAVIQPYLSPPRRLTLTTPVTSRPPAGKTLVWLQCETPQCKEISTALGSAVAAVDWNLRVVDYQSANPATLIAGMQQALQYRPVAVVLNGSPYAVWKGEVPAYAKAGVPLIVGSVGPVPINRTIVANIVGPPDISLAARILADWFIASSAAQGKALLYSVPDFPAIALIQTVFQQAVAQDCSGCSVTLLSQTIPQVASGELNPAVVSALQRSPAIRYVILPDYPLTSGLPEALSAAGIRGIKIAGIYAGRTDQELIRQGQEAAGTPQEINLSSWLTVDAAIRHLEGMPIAPGDGGLPEQLLTQSTVGTPSDTYNYPANYQQLFRHLWRVG
jgi:ribose transport system substrate-binding protein